MDLVDLVDGLYVSLLFVSFPENQGLLRTGALDAHAIRFSSWRKMKKYQISLPHHGHQTNP